MPEPEKVEEEKDGAAPREAPADPPLTVTVTIVGRGVVVSDATLPCGGQQFVGLRVDGRGPPPADRPAAEAEHRHAQPRAPELSFEDRRHLRLEVRIP